jgi:two-component system, OmpR family, sensor kinase
MKRSFQRQLLLQIGAAVILLGLLAATAQFILAWRELRESQDDMLRQVAALALARPDREASAVGKVRLGDSDSRLQLFVLPIDSRPPWLEPALAPGLHTVDSPQGRMRVEVRRAGPYTAIVAQPTDALDELAWSGAGRTLLPSLLLVPLLIGLISRLVRREFAPIARAAQRVDAQHVLHDPQLDIGDLPDEIQPFVDAIEGLLRRTHDLMRQQQRFIADAAHELRSPLTALALQGSNLRHAKSLQEVQQRLPPLQQGIERARRLSEQLLGLARVQGDATENESIDVSALARELLAEFYPLAEKRGIDLGLDAPEKLLATTSGTMLRTILSNAIDNAIKYTPTGREVSLAVRDAPGGVCVDVIDSGSGIPAAERTSVFRPFRRLKGNGVEGTGLGLAIASEAAARLGATLSLHDRGDRQGLVFRLFLPRRNTESPTEGRTPAIGSID